MSGRITIYMGCMYSGKTSALISSCRRHLSIDRKILVINYIADNRYSEFSEIVSHNKDKISCIKVTKLEDIPSTKDQRQQYLNDNDIVELIDPTNIIKRNH